MEPSPITEDVGNDATGLEAREEPPILQDEGEWSFEDSERPVTWMEGGEECPTGMDVQEESTTEGEEITSGRRDWQEPAACLGKGDKGVAEMQDGEEPAACLDRVEKSATRLEDEEELNTRLGGGEELDEGLT